MTSEKLRKHVIASNFPLVALVTFYIYPLIIAIMLLVNHKKYENSGLAIATGVLSLIGFCLVSFILGFILKPANNVNVASNE